MSFAETRLEDGFIVYNTRGGPRFLTNVVETESGFEQRTQVWANSRGEWDYGSRKVTGPELRSIEGFFSARNGMFQGFRFKDWGNYTASEVEVSEYGVLTQGIVGTVDTPDLIENQLYKKTTSGDDGIGNPFYHYRLIAKPCLGTVHVFFNDTEIEEVTDWEMDFSTGLITFISITPTPGDVITWRGEFDTPVRFNTDRLERTLIAGDPISDPVFTDRRTLRETYYELASLPIIEIRTR